MSRSKPSSRANGCHSHGPATQAGKNRSKQNSLKHGLAAKSITVLQTESQEDFNKLLQSYNDRFQPLDQLEADLVKDIADSRWGLLRLHLIETTQMSHAMRENPSGDSNLDMAMAFTLLAKGPALSLLLRYEAHLQMKMQRAMRNLIQLRKNIPAPLMELSLDDILRAESPAEAESPVEAQTSPDPQPAASPRVANPQAPAAPLFTKEVPAPPLRWTEAAA